MNEEDISEQVRCVIVNGGTNDMPCFLAAVRIGVGRLIVIGESQAIKDLAHQQRIAVEFLPSGSTPPDGSLVLDATKRARIDETEKLLPSGFQEFVANGMQAGRKSF